MKHPALPTGDKHRRLPFYLAAEEWIARTLPPDEYFFAWRVAPTVICGRNQDIACEVDLDYCAAHGIDVVRRRSGGGCVYADMANWMFSYICPDSGVDADFSRYTRTVIAMLASLGIEARASGRNDIYIGERKVAGNAFYHMPGRSIVHGTMLCSIDNDTMARAITPSRAKLEAKGVRSVPAHLTSLTAEGLTLPVDQLGPYAERFICRGGEIPVTETDIRQIEALEARYYEPEFLYGRRNDNTPSLRRQKRIEGIGEFEAAISISPDRHITTLNLTGDFFVSESVEQSILAPLVGVEYTRPAIERTLRGIDVEAAIPGMTHAELSRLLID